MKKIIVSILLLSAYSAMAQTGMHSKMKNDTTLSFGVYKTLGLSFQEFDGLNDRVKNDPDYKNICETIFTIGMGSIIQKNHFVALNNFTVGYGMNGNSKKKNSTTGMLGIAADFGYNFFGKNSRAELYPTVGLGLEGYRIRFNKANENVDFDDVLHEDEVQNDVRPVTFYNLFFNYRFGLTFAVKSKNKQSAIGLQAGYTASFNDNSWKINSGQSLANAPYEYLQRFHGSIYMSHYIDWSRHKSKMM